MNQSFITLIGGIGIGLLTCVAGQKAFNHYQVQQCEGLNYHRVITTSSFMGDTKYCIHISYLAN